MKHASLAATLGSLFPADVAYAEAGPEERLPPLAPGERELLGAGVSPQRLRDFSLGRFCARKALSLLAADPSAAPGLPPLSEKEKDGPCTENRNDSAAAVLWKPQSKAPLWPPGIVGAITHSGGRAAAAVAQESCYWGLGLDLEQLERLGPKRERLGARILRPEETQAIAALPPLRQRAEMLTIFSAKESIFKALYPAGRVYLGFQDATVELSTLQEKQGLLRWVLHKDCGKKRGHVGQGCFVRTEALVLTAIWVYH